jgi:uncharacterized protein (DUF3084 family)
MEKKEKPLEKMTAKELREVALEIPELKGVHAMKKEELLAAIRETRGTEEEVKDQVKGEVEEEREEVKEEVEEVKEEVKEEREEVKEVKKEKKVKKKVEKKIEGGVADLKKKIREFKALKGEAVGKGDARMAKIYKRRINRLKKRARKAA